MSLSHAHIILSTGWNLGIFSLFLLSISCILLVSALRGVSRTLIISNLFCQRCCSSGANRKCWKTRGKDYWTRHVSDGVYYWPVGRKSTLEKKKKKQKKTWLQRVSLQSLPDPISGSCLQKPLCITFSFFLRCLNESHIDLQSVKQYYEYN